MVDVPENQTETNQTNIFYGRMFIMLTCIKSTWSRLKDISAEMLWIWQWRQKSKFLSDKNYQASSQKFRRALYQITSWHTFVNTACFPVSFAFI